MTAEMRTKEKKKNDEWNKKVSLDVVGSVAIWEDWWSVDQGGGTTLAARTRAEAAGGG